MRAEEFLEKVRNKKRTKAWAKRRWRMGSRPLDTQTHGELCPECHGAGYLGLEINEPCWNCDGAGRIETNETAAVGIVTKQNTTADVGPGTLAQNIKKLFPNMKKTKTK
ncbi:hypothetical protein LCGC14_0794030 [marine sediment metagenome]|uniref:Uncharacterized protein n=1 Tax=marine sediment metagenome TaxID=412755 RepID=A0A0F9PRL0_9ZZZZ